MDAKRYEQSLYAHRMGGMLQESKEGGYVGYRDYAQLQAVNTILLAALRAVEWEGSGGGVRVCPECRYLHKEHRPDCQLHAALIAATKGTP